MRFGFTSTPNLPTELLSEILKNLDRDTKTLQQVSLACRRFHCLAQPLIFRNVCLTCRTNKDEVLRQSARLDFYSSDAIAPFVRKLSVSSFVRVRDGETSLVPEIFEKLPRFINIRSLSCWCIDFTVTRSLHQVSALSSLEHLVVTSGGCAPPQIHSSPMLRLRSFAFINEFGKNRRGVYYWLLLLDPDHLQTLRIPLTDNVCSFFLANGDHSLCPFPSLRSLDLEVDHETFRVLPRLLSKSPALRSLKLFRLYPYHPQYAHILEAFVPPTVCPVPYLEEYRGPHKLLPIILGQATGVRSAHLRRLFVESIGEEDDPLMTFMNSFKSCHPFQLKTLTHLHISLFELMDFKSLAELQDLFPVLQEFYLHASDRGGLSAVRVQDVDMTDLYTLPLPCTLVSLSIHWTAGWNIGAVPDLVMAKDNLLPRLPQLRRLWLSNLCKLALLWSRTSSRSEERCTLQKMRLQKPEDAWKLRAVAFPEDSIFEV